MLFQTVVQDWEKKKSGREGFHLYLTANKAGTGKKIQYKLCREATASQMKPCILASLTSKTFLHGINGFTQTFRDIKILFWTAELQR